jgi:ABC-type phosphate transport system permease subunit
VASHPTRGAAHRAARHHHRADAGGGARRRETAPLLFTAFNNRFWSAGLDKPMASLPVQIFTYAVSPYDDWHRQAWAAALVLVAAVLLLNVAARLVVWGRTSR